MGNEGSKLKDLKIDKNAVKVNNFWAMFNAVASSSTNEEGKQYLSIFQGEPVVAGELWAVQGPLERAIKNLMIFRHPYILKYVTTWEQGGLKYLGTERVRPLQPVLSQQSDIQICLGLRTILCSLVFLIEKAFARHINVCTQSIYVTDNGSWRLAGFEYVWKYKEVTKTLLDLASAHRYKKAIDPGESYEQSFEAIEQYSFATLCEEVLNKCAEKKTPNIPTQYVQEFREYCCTHLKHKNPQMRPKLSAVLLHPYFNHEFVLIHAFLFELPLKNNHEKQNFFTSLIDRLRYFDEELVGVQFAGDLLSRMVLLDPTAQLCVTPYVLRTKDDYSSALFSATTYSAYLMLHILKMFRLRDAQIRLILLEYFMEFVRLLTRDEIEENILPHLIAGMHDKNDVLVEKTLRCLADLVPILGATIVLGGQRTRLFADGRPQAAISDAAVLWVEPRSITPILGENGECPVVSGSPLPDNLTSKSASFSSLSQPVVSELYEHNMPPRLSPDGGEDIKCSGPMDVNTPMTSASTELPLKNAIYESEKQVTKLQDEVGTKNNSVTEEKRETEDELWSNWNDDEVEKKPNINELFSSENLANQSTHIAEVISVDDVSGKGVSPTKTSCSYGILPSQSLVDPYRTALAQSTPSSSYFSLKPLPLLQINDDLSTLDIQIQKSSEVAANSEKHEFDFFKDMEPVIEAAHSVPITTSSTWLDTTGVVVIDSKRFAATLTSNEEDNSGWCVDEEVDDLNIDNIETSQTARQTPC
uniref:Phosphatase 2A Regulatory Subunit A helical domain-containing protein n=1 Tax=Glossina palpalis gambiensis TaxID=67801 RepID=A0A1B0C5F8_9MUSC